MNFARMHTQLDKHRPSEEKNHLKSTFIDNVNRVAICSSHFMIDSINKDIKFIHLRMSFEKQKKLEIIYSNDLHVEDAHLRLFRSNNNQFEPMMVEILVKYYFDY